MSFEGRRAIINHRKNGRANPCPSLERRLLMDIHYRPGLRAVKSALAVFICLLVSIPLHRESPFFSCIASIVCMQPTWEKSLRTGFHRFYGTVLGGTAGYLSLVLFDLLPHYREGLYVVILPLGVLALITLCNVLGIKESSSICCIVFLANTANFKPIPEALPYVCNRVIETTIGIVIAVLVNRYVRLPQGEAQQSHQS